MHLTFLCFILSRYAAATSLFRSIYLMSLIDYQDTHTAHDINPDYIIAVLNIQGQRGSSHVAKRYLFLRPRLPPVFEPAKQTLVYAPSKPSQFNIPSLSLARSSYALKPLRCRCRVSLVSFTMLAQCSIDKIAWRSEWLLTSQTWR